MREIIGINHIGLRVRDLDRAREFYEKLGFKFLVGPIGPEPVAIMEHPSGVNINFILNANAASGSNILMDVPEKYPGYTHIALNVSDVHAMIEKLQSAGIELSEGPVSFPGGTSIFIRDQDNNVVEFHQDDG